MQLVGESMTIDRTQAAVAVVQFFAKSDANNIFSVVSGKYRNLTLTRQDFRQQEDGNYLVTATYEGESNETSQRSGGGSGSPDGPEGKIYEWSPSFEQTDIAKHPRIEDLLNKYQGVVDEGTGSVSFPKTLSNPKSGLGGSDNAEGTTNPMFGVTEFLSLGGTWSEQSLKKSIPEDLFTSIGTIVRKVPGGLPTPARRFWLQLPPIVVQHGDRWKVTRRWMLSGVSSDRDVLAARDIYQ